MSKKKNIKLAPGDKNKMKFTKGRIELFLGGKKNKFVLEFLSPWLNFKDKSSALTLRPYVYDPDRYDPDNPDNRARKLIGRDEVIILGSVRNRIYFSGEGKVDKNIEPEHVKIYWDGEMVEVENVSNNLIKILL